MCSTYRWRGTVSTAGCCVMSRDNSRINRHHYIPYDMRRHGPPSWFRTGTEQHRTHFTLIRSLWQLCVPQMLCYYRNIRSLYVIDICDIIAEALWYRTITSRDDYSASNDNDRRSYSADSHWLVNVMIKMGYIFQSLTWLKWAAQTCTLSRHHEIDWLIFWWDDDPPLMSLHDTCKSILQLCWGQ